GIAYMITNAEADDAGEYRVVLTNANCTFPSDVVSVSVKSEQDVGITGGDTVCIDATLALDATVAGGTWSSTDETVATVDANGIVTGVGVGTVAIFYTLPGDPDYCETVTEINVQVNPTPTVDAITD